jgi:HEPN domain-containing protein
MKEENRKIITGRWMKKSREDELSAQSMLKHRDGTPSVACFLCQQMAEKYLKALLIFLDLELIKTHDLIKLSSILEEKVPEITEISDELAKLNRFYIETRYVGDYPEFSWQDAEEAFKAAKKIRDFVLKKIGG